MTFFTDLLLLLLVVFRSKSKESRPFFQGRNPYTPLSLVSFLVRAKLGNYFQLPNFFALKIVAVRRAAVVLLGRLAVASLREQCEQFLHAL